ncbi:hypothetical protein A4308_12180 [Enterobacter sp. ODB01]|nr:hypothetical protein A4308_12180 [Enterobacter sp. ODB01]
MDGKYAGRVTANVDYGTWNCQYFMPAAGKHTFSTKFDPPINGDANPEYTYMIAAPLTITSPPDNALVNSPVTLSGQQQSGATVTYTSDNCGSGTAGSNGSAWTTSPITGAGRCAFSFIQTWQGLSSPVVSRTLTLAAAPDVKVPAQNVPEGTRYAISGTGEPGATIDISLDNGWYAIDSVTVRSDGQWQAVNPGPSSGSGEYRLTIRQKKNGVDLGMQEKIINVTGTGTPSQASRKQK